MKRKLTIILSALACMVAAAQTPEDYHFSVKDNYVTWQLVYAAPIDTDAALDYLLGSGNFADVTDVSDGISFTILPRSVDFAAAGFKRLSVPMYLVNYPMTAHGLLQVRDGRYRVTVDHVSFVDNPPMSLELFALRKGGVFAPLFVSGKAAFILDNDFTALFTIPTETTEEDW